MANILHPGYSSKISFAPDTNFEESFRSKKISSNAALFNIRRVDNGNSSSQDAPGIPPATARESFADQVDNRAEANVQRLPKIDTSSNPHLAGLFQTFPAPAGLDISTLCSYVRQDKPLLSAAKSSLSGVLKVKSSDFPRMTHSVDKPVMSRFPPLGTRQHSFVGTDKAKVIQLKSDMPRKYGSLDSLNLYLRQSTLSLNHDSVDVFMPYRHIPNLVESRRRSKTFLQDNERIRMLQSRCKTDDIDRERLDAYKLPEGEGLVEGFMTSK